MENKEWKGTVLLTSRAPIGYVAIAENEICTNQGFKSLVLNEELTYNKFIYYWIKNNVEYLQSIGTGTTFAEISGNVVKEIDIKLPPLPEQKAIASVLSSLDDKIDLLHQQNQTLEALAETLFRQWFIEEAKEDWERSTLGDIAEVKNGKSFKSSDFSDIEFNSYEVVKMGHIERGGGLKMNPKKDYISRDMDVSKFILSKGDIIMAMTDMIKMIIMF